MYQAMERAVSGPRASGVGTKTCPNVALISDRWPLWLYTVGRHSTKTKPAGPKYRLCSQ